MRPILRSAVVLALAAAVLFTKPCAAAAPPLDRAWKESVVEKAIALVAAHYVDLDRAKAVGAALRQHVRAGSYAGDATIDAFREHLNLDLQQAGGDKHLRINDNPQIVAQLRREADGPGDLSPEYVAMLKRENFRLRRVESLEGNVGYFKIDNFVELRLVKDAFVGAMNFLQTSSAIILDLTDNGGGSSETSDLMVSYFLPVGTRVGEIWERETNRTEPSTVERHPEVRPLLGVPVVILVGDRTASAAEAVAYTLQQFKRATIVGSPTKGMANAGRLFPIDDRLFMMVPTRRHTNAVSGSNWEGTGVRPDIVVEPARALDRAMAVALDAAAERSESPKEAFRLRFLAEDYASRVTSEPPPAGFLEACVGTYEGGRRIALDQGRLHFLQRDTDRTLHYMSQATFRVEGRTDYRLRFDVEAGRAGEMRVFWFDDTSDTFARTP